MRDRQRDRQTRRQSLESSIHCCPRCVHCFQSFDDKRTNYKSRYVYTQTHKGKVPQTKAGNVDSIFYARAVQSVTSKANKSRLVRFGQHFRLDKSKGEQVKEASKELPQAVLNTLQNIFTTFQYSQQHFKLPSKPLQSNSLSRIPAEKLKVNFNKTLQFAEHFSTFV